MLIGGISTLNSRVVDVGGSTVSLSQVVLLASGINATLSGFFVDLYGNQIGASVTGTVDTTPRTLVGVSATRVFALETLPPGAVGFRGRLSADVVLGLGGQENNNVIAPEPALSSDMTAFPTRYPLISSTTDFSIGRTG